MMSLYNRKFMNICWNRRKSVAILSVPTVLLVVFFINHQNYSFTVKKLQFPSILKSVSTTVSKNYLSVQDVSRDRWLRFAKGVYGYSAYWDSRMGRFHPFLRVITIADRNVSTLANLKCQVKIGTIEDEGVLLLDLINEHHDEKHAAVIINCIPKKITNVPEEVTIFSIVEKREKQWMPVKRIEPGKQSIKDKMAVCVRPLFGPFNQTHSLAGFISFYLAIGFSHFIFYDQSISNETNNYLRKLTHEISLDILLWNIPSNVKDAWAYGQLANIQDCIYRCMYLYEYVLIVDLDEYVVPKYHHNLQEAINAFVDKAPTKLFGAFIIRQAFYCVNPNENSTTIFDNIRRLSIIWPAKLRSKVIVKPEAIVVSGIHSIERMFGKWLEVVLPIEFVVLHHYRSGVCDDDRRFDWRNSSIKEDRSALKYRNVILHSRPLQVWKEVFL